MTNQALVPADIEQRYEVCEWRNGSALLRTAHCRRIVVDNVQHVEPTHKVDCYKNRVAQEAKRSNPFCDLDSFRLPFDLRAANASLIVTRCAELQMTFDVLGRDLSYGSSPTHMAKLRPRLDGGSGGGCPVVVFGIRRTAYVED